jgi:hypothetical protein
VETGTYISGVGHVALISWALLGSAFSGPVSPPDTRVTEVSVISAAAFDAMVSQTPVPVTEVAALNNPNDPVVEPKAPSKDTKPDQAVVSAPDTPKSADKTPNLSGIKAPPRADAQIVAPVSPEPPSTDQIGATLIVPTAPVASEDQNGRKKPDQLAMVAPAEQAAPKVDRDANPKPPTDAEKSDQTEKATVKDKAATTPAEDKTEKAPDQSSTEIITEAKEKKETVAPLQSSRPKGRPADLSDKARAASEIETAMAAAVAEATASKPSAPARPAATGPGLSAAEVEGLRLAVRACWNVGSMSTDAMRITVVVGVSMSQDGRPQNETIHQISATPGSATATNQAFETARRAIIRCGAKGFDLPSEKYDHWRDVEITFNPEKMRNK